MDFVHDQLALGKKLRILTIFDTHWRRHKDEDRPAKAIGYELPVESLNHDGVSGRPL